MSGILDFIEDHTCRLVYPEKSDDGSDYCQDCQQPQVGSREFEDIVVSHAV